MNLHRGDDAATGMVDRATPTSAGIFKRGIVKRGIVRGAKSMMTGWLTAIVLTSAAQAQVVQLPTFHSFGYSGAVRVPDRGTTSLGGSTSSMQGFNRRGIAGGGLGAGRSFGNASVTTTIIDHAAIDRQIRGIRPGDPRTSRRTVTARPSPAEIREGKSLVRYARSMRTAGNHSLARRAYELAFEKLDAKLRRFAEAEYARFYPPAVTIANRR